MLAEKMALLDSLAFRTAIVSLNDETDVRPLRQLIDHLNEHLSSVNLKGPLYAMIHEIAANSLKALYKRAFFRSLKVEDHKTQNYAYWLALFRSELEERSAHKLVALLEKNQLSVELIGRRDGEDFLIEAISPGEPSEIEKQRIETALERGRRLNSFGFLLMEESGEEENREGGSLGIPLIIMSLRSLGLSVDAFSIQGGDGRTVTSLRLPAHFFTVPKSYKVRVLKNTQRHLALVWNAYNALNMGAARFDRGGHLVSVSEILLQQMETSDPDEFERALPPRFIVDLFHGDDRVQPDHPMEHYRLYVKSIQSREEVLYNVSAYMNGKEFVTVIFQRLPMQLLEQRPRTGSVLEHLRLHNMIEPYIPVPLLLKARESVQLGLEKLSDEIRPVTILFGDLAGFTGQTERMQPDTALEFLNIAMSISVRFIEKHGGFVDKFMGDAIMAIFYNPLPAVVAGLEIQNQFQQLNHFRAMSHEMPINVRVGINTGQVILGNVGSSNRMDWTAIGDTVNTASRIEKLAEPGEVLIGAGTFEEIKDRLEVADRGEIQVRGRVEKFQVYSVKKATWSHHGQPLEISLETPLLDLALD